MGRFDPELLPVWQKKERERLAELREAADAPAEWPYEGVYRVGQDGRIPSGYRVGGTAIVCLALLEAWPVEEQRARAALARGADFVLGMLESDGDMLEGRKTGYDVRGWGFTYALALARVGCEHEAFDEDRRAALRASVPVLLERLADNRQPDGGWNYTGYKCSPFQTGATVLELLDAREAGFEVPEELLGPSLDALARTRTETVTYTYDGRGRGAVPGPASAARSAVAELALVRGGREDTESLVTAVDVFFDGWEELHARAGRQGTHEGDYGIAPYYFFFGHRYAAEAIEALPESLRAKRREDLRQALLRTRDERGAWNDRIFPRSEAYGTAMALLALLASDRPDGHADADR